MEENSHVLYEKLMWRCIQYRCKRYTLWIHVWWYGTILQLFYGFVAYLYWYFAESTPFSNGFRMARAQVWLVQMRTKWNRNWAVMGMFTLETTWEPLDMLSFVTIVIRLLFLPLKKLFHKRDNMFSFKCNSKCPCMWIENHLCKFYLPGDNQH